MKKSLMRKFEVVDRIGSGDAYISGFSVWIIKGEWKLPGCAGIWKCSQVLRKIPVRRDMLWDVDPQEMQQTIEMHHNIGQDFEMKR